MAFPLEVYGWSGAWADRTETITPQPELDGPVVFSPQFWYPEEFTAMVTPWTFGYSSGYGYVRYAVTSAAAVAERPLDFVMWLGRSAQTGGGYRISNTYLCSVEGRWVQTGTFSIPPDWNESGVRYANVAAVLAVGSLETCLVFRDPTTYAVLGYKRLFEAESYAELNHPDRCVLPGYGVFPYRAGIVVRPSADGTWVVSILDSNRAWVYEAIAVSEEDPTLTATLLETVSFDHTYAGAVRVLYK